MLPIPGVFVEPFLQYILDGKKTIETRFSAVRCAPYERAEQGDIILLKKSGGPIIGLCQIKSVSSYRLEKDAWKQIKTFAKQICAEDPSFWEDRKRASYATLMHINNVAKISPLEITKRDRRGWVVLHEATRQKGAVRNFV